MTPEQKENKKEYDREYYDSHKSEFVARRRKRYDEKNTDLFCEQRERNAKSFKKFEGHPTFDRSKINETRKKIAELIGKKSFEDVEDVEVWGLEQLFNVFGQTRYDVDSKTGTVTDTILDDGTFDYIDDMLTEWHDQIAHIENRTCSICCERWFHYRGKRDDPDTELCYIAELPQWRVDSDNYMPTPEERTNLLAKWFIQYPNETKPPSDRLLMIANLVQLNRESKHTCNLCKHGTPSRFKKHKLSGFQRQRVFSRFNFAIPPPGPLAQLELTDEEEYIISRCIVAMRIENRLNDAARPVQSKRTGHACILPLDFAHTYADYVNQHSLPRRRDNLLFYEVVQEGGADTEYTFRVNAEKMQNALAWRKRFNIEYADVPVSSEIFDDYRRHPEVKARIVRIDPPEETNTDVDTTAPDVTYDEPQEHKDNEVVRVTHHGANDGVEHVNTTTEQERLDAAGQHKPVYG